MMTRRKIHCRYCAGTRPVSPGGICLGCGSPAESAAESVTARERHCPKCTDGVLRLQPINGIAYCSSCGYSTHDFAGRRPVHV